MTAPSWRSPTAAIRCKAEKWHFGLKPDFRCVCEHCLVQFYTPMAAMRDKTDLAVRVANGRF
jgi:hypothetical protein